MTFQDEIYHDEDFLKVVGDIMEKCPMQMDTTETSASITADYSNCAAADAFDPACTAATGEGAEAPPSLTFAWPSRMFLRRNNSAT